jgi:hypothetical protein
MKLEVVADARGLPLGLAAAAAHVPENQRKRSVMTPCAA